MCLSAKSTKSNSKIAANAAITPSLPLLIPLPTDMNAKNIPPSRPTENARVNITPSNFRRSSVEMPSTGFSSFILLSLFFQHKADRPVFMGRSCRGWQSADVPRPSYKSNRIVSSLHVNLARPFISFALAGA